MTWVIAGQPEDAIPVIGDVYEIRDSRKGTFTGRIIAIRGIWADVERLIGSIYWASNEYNLCVGPRPDIVTIRDSLAYLIEKGESDGNNKNSDMPDPVCSNSNR